MPLYEYQCESCGRRTEALQRVDDPPLAECPECGGSLRKLLSAPAFQFKGSGWYATDYAAKSKPGKAAEGAAESSSSAGGSSESASKESSSGSSGASSSSQGASTKPAGGD